MKSKIDKIFDKALQGKPFQKEFEKYQIEQEIKDLIKTMHKKRNI